jgi:hypothetical protein
MVEAIITPVPRREPPTPRLTRPEKRALRRGEVHVDNRRGPHPRPAQQGEQGEQGEQAQRVVSQQAGAVVPTTEATQQKLVNPVSAPARERGPYAPRPPQQHVGDVIAIFGPVTEDEFDPLQSKLQIEAHSTGEVLLGQNNMNDGQLRFNIEITKPDGSKRVMRAQGDRHYSETLPFAAGQGASYVELIPAGSVVKLVLTTAPRNGVVVGSITPK